MALALALAFALGISSSPVGVEDGVDFPFGFRIVLSHDGYTYSMFGLICITGSAYLGPDFLSLVSSMRALDVLMFGSHLWTDFVNVIYVFSLR